MQMSQVVTFPGAVAPGIYLLENVASRTFLDLDSGKTANGTRVQGWQFFANNPCQQWILSIDPNSRYYYIQNVASRTFLDLDGGKTANGTRLQGWAQQGPTSSAQPNQLFWFSLEPDGISYRIINKQSSTCIDFNLGQSQNGTNVQGWQYVTDNKNQRFYLHRVA